MTADKKQVRLDRLKAEIGSDPAKWSKTCLAPYPRWVENEIDKLIQKTKEKGFTIVPLSLYFKDGKAKVEIGVARGKKIHDKRQALAERQATRETARAISDARKSNPRA